MSSQKIIIIGAGIFGLTAALDLRRRSHQVVLLDPGPAPHPLAASTDISKAVRLEYGADTFYVELMERSLEGWRAWNEEWGAPLFHETGALFLRASEMVPGTFEYESWRLLRERGHPTERVRSDAIAARFPAWNSHRYVDGTYNPRGGYAESGKVVAHLCGMARAEGVQVHEGEQTAGLLEEGGRVTGVRTVSGRLFEGDSVLAAAGSWTPSLLPWLSASLRSVGMPVFHLKPDRPARFEADRFPVFGADISATGYYGFPVNPDGIVKIANHGPGREMHPHAPERVVTPQETEELRLFLHDTFPDLAEAPIVYTRVCLYCDTWDGHFWIAPDPEHPGLVVATGGSGHAFKFAPVLGAIIADAVEGRENPCLHRFRWRPDIRPNRSDEGARRQSPVTSRTPAAAQRTLN